MSNSKRKILFLVESLDSGDAGKALSVLVQYIDKSKYDVTVCAINGGGQYEAIIRENANYKAILTDPDGIKRTMVYRNLPLSLVYKFYVPQGNDVEFAYSEGFVTKLLSRASKGKTKRYAWVHTDLAKNHWTSDFFSSTKEETEAYNKFDKVACTTNLLTEAFKKQFPDVKVPVETVYDPIDSLSVRLKSLNVSNPDENPVKVRLVSQGRLEPQYQYARMLRVINRLVKEGYDVGQTRVKLFGSHPNPYRFMIQGQLFVCSAYHSSVMKALILGLPVVATETPELKEILKNGDSGLMTPNTEEALYKGIKSLLDDPNLLEQYRQKGEARGWDFDIEALMAPYETLFQA